MKRAMVRCAHRTVVLCDSSKIGREHLIRFAPLDAIDVLVTDSRLDDAVARDLAAREVEVVTA